jgi:hypothetical protein
MVREGDAGFSGVGFHRNVNHQAARRSPWAKKPPLVDSSVRRVATRLTARATGFRPARRPRPRHPFAAPPATAHIGRCGGGFQAETPARDRHSVGDLRGGCDHGSADRVARHRAAFNAVRRTHRLRNPSIVRSVVWATNPRRSMSAAMSAVMDIIAEDLTKAATSASRLVGR